MENNILKEYWNSYGGWRALVSSRYLWISVVLTIILFPHWSQPKWWDTVLSVMPNVLGFSLGGYAMWMAIGDDEFRKLISGRNEDGERSPYMAVNAAFVHFILLQLVSIISALIAKAYYFSLPSDHFVHEILGDGFIYFVAAGYFLGYFVFVYAIVSAFAATLELLRVSSWYDNNHTIRMKNERAGVIVRDFLILAYADYVRSKIEFHSLKKIIEENGYREDEFFLALKYLYDSGFLNFLDADRKSTSNIEEALYYRLTSKGVSEASRNI